jgi:hypothetical protein
MDKKCLSPIVFVKKYKLESLFFIRHQLLP